MQYSLAWFYWNIFHTHRLSLYLILTTCLWQSSHGASVNTSLLTMPHGSSSSFMVCLRTVACLYVAQKHLLFTSIYHLLCKGSTTNGHGYELSDGYWKMPEWLTYLADFPCSNKNLQARIAYLGCSWQMNTNWVVPFNSGETDGGIRSADLVSLEGDVTDGGVLVWCLFTSTDQ